MIKFWEKKKLIQNENKNSDHFCFSSCCLWQLFKGPGSKYSWKKVMHGQASGTACEANCAWRPCAFQTLKTVLKMWKSNTTDKTTKVRWIFSYCQHISVARMKRFGHIHRPLGTTSQILIAPYRKILLKICQAHTLSSISSTDWKLQPLCTT